VVQLFINSGNDITYDAHILIKSLKSCSVSSMEVLVDHRSRAHVVPACSACVRAVRVLRMATPHTPAEVRTQWVLSLLQLWLIGVPPQGDQLHSD
jgi:hypothetical protein